MTHHLSRSLKRAVLLIAALAISALAANDQPILWPVGEWPLCDVGVSLPGCTSGPHPYTYIITGRAPEYSITTTLTNGEIVTIRDLAPMQAFALVAPIREYVIWATRTTMGSPRKEEP